MKFPSLNPYYRTALLLIVMAGILIITAVLTNRSDFTSAELVVAGLVCLLTGVFFTTLSGSDPLDLRYLSLFPAQGSINLTRTCADLGIQGNASIIPKGREGRTRTMQFIPVAVYNGEPLPMDSFVTGPDTAGILMDPSCAPLLRLLQEREHLVIPPDMPALHSLIRELGVDVLEVAGRVRSTHEGEIISVTLEEYRLIGGCRVLAEESPRCCTTNPCPVCSLFASVFAEGTGKVIQLERCAPDPKRPTVMAVFSVLSE
ncbi:MAG: hypothetical protein ABSG28_11300 [Methanoregula sp.]|jgi:hypothetical protein|uniref:hypothetical protein n=1 Tax=Methanoregula sp. TaxID=2052170 RepID=UPI003C1636AD